MSNNTEPPYLDRVAEAVAARIRERGTVFTTDELATVAMALDCKASDLLPLHLSAIADTEPTCPTWCHNDPTACRGDHTGRMLGVSATGNGNGKPITEGFPMVTVFPVVGDVAGRGRHSPRRR